MKFAITFLLGLLVGLGFNQLKAPKPQQPVAVQVQGDSELKKKLQTLTDSEIEHYYQLKTMEERYQKADEILGKIVLLLLKDIGLRISENAKNEINNPERATRHNFKSNPIISPSPEPQVQPKRYPLRNWTEFETKLTDIRSPLQAGEFLNDVKIDNFANEFTSASDFSNKNNMLPELSGKFIGVAQVVHNNKNKTWDLEIEILGEMEGPNLKGTSIIKISENGKVFSNSRDRGNIRSVKEFASDSQATLIRASPTLSFQIYSIKALDSLIGNVYESGRGGRFTRIGTLELKRP